MWPLSSSVRQYASPHPPAFPHLLRHGRRMGLLHRSKLAARSGAPARGDVQEAWQPSWLRAQRVTGAFLVSLLTQARVTRRRAYGSPGKLHAFRLCGLHGLLWRTHQHHHAGREICLTFRSSGPINRYAIDVAA